MKKIIYLFAICLTQQLWSQDPQLFENEWYLQMVVINGEDSFPPFPSVIGRVYFDTESIEVVHPNCEEGFGKSIDYLPNDIFETDDGGVVLVGTCGNPETIEFMNKHYSVYYDLNSEIAKNPFTYSFTQNNDITTLTISNVDGDEAIYGDELLYVNDFLEFDLTIYPNPAELYIFIKSSDLVDDSEFTLYNSIGNVVLRTKPNNSHTTKIDMSSLTSGLYFISITFKNGYKSYKKIIKK